MKEKITFTRKEKDALASVMIDAEEAARYILDMACRGIDAVRRKKKGSERIQLAALKKFLSAIGQGKLTLESLCYDPVESIATTLDDCAADVIGIDESMMKELMEETSKWGSF